MFLHFSSSLIPSAEALEDKIVLFNQVNTDHVIFELKMYSRSKEYETEASDSWISLNSYFLHMYNSEYIFKHNSGTCSDNNIDLNY